MPINPNERQICVNNVLAPSLPSDPAGMKRIEKCHNLATGFFIVVNPVTGQEDMLPFCTRCMGVVAEVFRRTGI